MPLTDAKCRAAKPRTKAYLIADGGGLCLEITPTGSRLWRLRYRFEGKATRISFGKYPETSLAEAREKRDGAKKLLKEGIDPAAKRKEVKAETVAEAGNTFEAMAREWHTHNLAKWGERHGAEILYRLEKDIFPAIGPLPIRLITTPIMLAAIEAIQRRGALELARRAMNNCSHVFCYAVARNRADIDPTWPLKGQLQPQKKSHHAALKPEEIPAFLRCLSENAYRLNPQTMRSMWFMMLTFQRTKEMIEAPWEEIDWEAKVWRIPPTRMKMGRPHVVPLSRQALKILEDQRDMTGDKGYIWPSLTKIKGHMSNQTLLVALRRMGYGYKLVPHGFRATAATAIVEVLGIDPKLPDLQLSHSDKDKVASAYNRAERLAERTAMMQAWADYLEATSLAYAGSPLR